MSRTVAVVWHASFSVVGGVLCFFFVLPRWPELLGDTSHTLGTVLRIVAGALIGLAALPVEFTLQRVRDPQLDTPQQALTLQTASIALHVFAGTLIIGTAISEIWLPLDSAGSWLFGIYGAAAATALLGIVAFYLAAAAELPVPAPKPVTPKKSSQQRRRDAAEEEAAQEDTPDASSEAAAVPDESPAEDEPVAETSGKLRNRRPSGPPTRPRRPRGRRPD